MAFQDAESGRPTRLGLVHPETGRARLFSGSSFNIFAEKVGLQLHHF